MRRAGIGKQGLLSYYISNIRSVLEYACQVWSTALTKEQSNDIESIQKRALRIIYPDSDYLKALLTANLQSLFNRRLELCKTMFCSIKNDDHHRLHYLLPELNLRSSQLRNKRLYQLPTVRTNRFKNSFINYGLFN